MFLPAVIICCHGNTSITHSSFFCKNHFRHCSHIDNVSSPAAEHQTFCLRTETWAFNGDHRPFGMTLQAKLLGSLNKNLQNMSISWKGNNSPGALLLHHSRKLTYKRNLLYTKLLRFIWLQLSKPWINFTFLIQQEKLIVLLLVNISWITVYSADQEDWKTEIFAQHLGCAHTENTVVNTLHWALHCHRVELSCWEQ